MVEVYFNGLLQFRQGVWKLPFKFEKEIEENSGVVFPMQFRQGVWKLPLSAEWKIEKNLEVVFNGLH